MSGPSSKMGNFLIKWKTPRRVRSEITSLEACEPSGLNGLAGER